MANPFLGEIRMVAFNYAPKGWTFCNGQLMAINQNAALFSLLGTTYGGNGVQTFALPNLQSRSPLHFGGNYVQGQMGGEVNHTLLITEMPAHAHLVNAVSHPGSLSTPNGNFLAAHRGGYANPTDAPVTALHPASMTSTGGSQPHNNLPPYLVLNFVIALSGIFPSRN